MTTPQLHFDDKQFGEVELREGRRNVIGRAEGDIVVRHEKISKRHAALWRDGDHWRVNDAGSTNGVFVNGNRITEATVLAHGDRVAFGPVEGRFIDPDGAARMVAAAPSSGPVAPAAHRKQRRTWRASTPFARLVWGTVVIAWLLLGLLWAIEWNTRAGTKEAVEAARARQDSRDQGDAASPAAQPRSNDEGVDDPPRESNDSTPSDPMFDPVPEPESAVPDSAVPASGPSDPTFVAADPVNRSAPPPPQPDSQPRRPNSTQPDPSTPVAAEPAKEDPIDRALHGRDFGALVRLLVKDPESPRVVEIEAFLTAGPIVALERSGRLPGAGEAIVASVVDECFPRRISWNDAMLTQTLPFKIDVRQRTLNIRYQHDYTVGLGRSFGAERIAPHPKRISIELLRPGKNGRREQLFQIDARTPAKTAEHLKADGLSEDEVWIATIEPLRERLERQLRRSLD